jgi:hypothetical protein
MGTRRKEAADGQKRDFCSARNGRSWKSHPDESKKGFQLKLIQKINRQGPTATNGQSLAHFDRTSG